MKQQILYSIDRIYFIDVKQMQGGEKQKQKSSSKAHTHSQKINNKPSFNVIQRNPSIDLLKKMLFKTKNRSEYVPNEESLLFDRNGSLAMLKAYRNRKKIILEDTMIKGKQYELGKLQNDKSLAVDELSKGNFSLESAKYQFDKTDINQKLYTEIKQKIDSSTKYEANKLPQIPFVRQKMVKNFVRSQNENLSWEKNTLPALNHQEDESLKLRLSEEISNTIQPNTNYQLKNGQFYGIKRIKNSNFKDGTNILLMKGSLRQSLQNPQISANAKINMSKINYGTMSEYKIKKQAETVENVTNLPEIKAVKSVKSLVSKNNRHHKGYMYFHMEANKFLKKHRENINEPAKIKDFLISGITASSYAAIDVQTMIPIAAKNFNKKIQIASISKVMTCYLCLLACKKYEIDYKKYPVRITLEASEMNGTSADLEIGDFLTLQDLLYALMLPSGNDAAVAVAQTVGKIIQRHKKKQTKKTYYQTFIAHMNILSRELKLEQEWKNSHGLPFHPNYSTPKAICQLTVGAMMDQNFREIVSCKEYECTIKNERTGLKKICKWKNTNKLLHEGWEGVKTGTTDSAGHCLMSKKGRYLIAVFDSKTLSKRFTECIQLYDLVKSKERFLFPQKWD